jgi:hypothetical protein
MTLRTTPKPWSEPSRTLGSATSEIVTISALCRTTTIYHDHDLYHPELVARLIELLDNHPRVGFAFSAAHVVSYTDPNRVIATIEAPWTEITQGHKVRRHLLRHWRSPIVAPTVIARRACFDQVGVYDESLLLNADRELWIRVLRHWDVGYIATPLVRLREAETPATMTAASAQAIWESLAGHVATQEKHIRIEYADAPLRLWAERRYLAMHSFARYWAQAAWALANNKTEVINLGPRAFSRRGMPISAATLQLLNKFRGCGQMIAKVANAVKFLRWTR